ncbi:MAG: FAD-dependent oxidoreductase [Kineosporiaceae bacterium]
MTQRVTVVGAGVVGLSCAVRLAEAGRDVAVLARDLPGETTSSMAGALWLPGPPPADPRWTAWAWDTWDELARLARADDAATGVRLLPGTITHRRRPPAPPWPFRPRTVDLDSPTAVAAARPLPAVDEVLDPAPGFGYGLRTDPVPVVDMPVHLLHLRRRLEAAGGSLTRMPLPALPTRGLVVNATGLAARVLTPDPAVRPLTGQSVVLEDPGLEGWWYDGDDAGSVRTYAVPHGGRVVVGGTAVLDQWSTDPDPATGEQILARARAMVPQLADARVLAHRIGMRPWRPSVRLEAERRPNRDDAAHVVVHCYGHGSDGVALAWGCAGEVLALAEQVAAGPSGPPTSPAAARLPA